MYLVPLKNSIYKSWKQPKCPAIGVWLKTLACLHSRMTELLKMTMMETTSGRGQVRTCKIIISRKRTNSMDSLMITIQNIGLCAFNELTKIRCKLAWVLIFIKSFKLMVKTKWILLDS